MTKMVSVVFAVMATALIATGCIHFGGYRPVIDTYRDPNAFRVPQDERECRELAERSASKKTKAASRARVVLGDDEDQVVDSRFKRAFIDCMAERGHDVVE
ncbi:hypothetical protein [Methylococcus sp. EFPC2]|uniref:hypothetical protein n=1 Tax=Methylococcus sp. EFPC2 TaxID=2812648 RepID=UPI0019678518|nr:hypothetical protein [Methylococcus sp. EFPC2]QSA98517.1 hypothetical protein JWZ97_06870 [Methylococcus sp. EFPC2]